MATHPPDWHLFRAFLAVVREGSLSSAARVLGTGLNSQPAASTVTGELNSLIGNLCSGASPCTSTARVLAVTSAACAAAFGSADMLIN